jgi:hypothetical protein
MAAAGATVIGGGGVGVGVGDGVADGDGAGVNGMPGIGVGGEAAGEGDGEGEGVTGAFVAAGAGGFISARGTAADAKMHPARMAPPKNTARGLTP